jgi:hypothetical protein
MVQKFGIRAPDDLSFEPSYGTLYSLPLELLQNMILTSVKDGNTIASICSITDDLNKICSDSSFLARVWAANFGPVPDYITQVDVRTIDKETIIRRKLQYFEVGKDRNGSQMFHLWDQRFYTLTRDAIMDEIIFTSGIVGGPGFVMVESSNLPEGFEYNEKGIGIINHS